MADSALSQEVLNFTHHLSILSAVSIQQEIRLFFYDLHRAGFNPIISAPAKDKSGKGSNDGSPIVVHKGCQYHSCPKGSPPTGHNESDPRLNVSCNHQYHALTD